MVRRETGSDDPDRRSGSASGGKSARSAGEENTGSGGTIPCRANRAGEIKTEKMKMKKTLWSFCAAVSALLAVGCGEKAQDVRDAEGFPPAQELTADSIAIDQVLQPQWGGVYGDYAVLISPKTSKVVWRYRLPEWTLADSSLVMGGGPDDLQYAFLQGSNGADEAFWISEPIKHALLQYAGGPDGKLRKVRSVANETPLSVYFGQVMNDRVVINDRRAHDFDMGSAEGVETYLYSSLLEDGRFRVMDSVLCHTVSRVQVKKEGEMTYVSTWTYNNPTYRCWGDRLAVWYGDTENMLVYRVDDAGKMTLETTYGDTLALAGVREADMENIQYGQAYPPRFVAATQKHLYFQKLTLDRPLSQNPDEPFRVQEHEILVYDWVMNPVAKFRLDRLSNDRAYVDETRGRIYTYDPNEDFEQVYVYRYDL